jgi:hypothetical protein
MQLCGIFDSDDFSVNAARYGSFTWQIEHHFSIQLLAKHGLGKGESRY